MKYGSTQKIEECWHDNYVSTYKTSNNYVNFLKKMAEIIMYIGVYKIYRSKLYDNSITKARREEITFYGVRFLCYM